MTRDRPLLALAAAAGASYPALPLGWCVVALLGSSPHARSLWLGSWPVALAVLALVTVGSVAISNASCTLIRALWQTRRLHRWVAHLRVRSDDQTAACGTRGRVRVVGIDEQLAITVGLCRPYVVLSRGLITAVSPAELRAIVAHERAHVRRRDPLRLLTGRVLAAHLWFVPLAGDLRNRASRAYELTADRHAVHSCGRAAVVGALLRVATTPGMVSAVAAQFSTPELLEARVSQLERGQPPRPAAVTPLRAAETAGIAMVLVTAVAGAWAFMLLACPCAVGMGWL